MRDSLCKGDPRNYLWSVYDNHSDWWTDSIEHPWAYEYLLDYFAGYNDCDDFCARTWRVFDAGFVAEFWDCDVVPAKKITRRRMQDRYNKLAGKITYKSDPDYFLWRRYRND